MENNLPTYELLKDTPKVIPMIYEDLAQPAVKKVGTALSTVFELSNTILLPLKLLNEKAKLNFRRHMENYKNKLNEIETEKIIDVSTIVGTPIIDRLTYITNDEIADMFINLLAKASSSETVNEAHPTFTHIIDRMTVDEARIIQYFSNLNRPQLNFIPFLEIKIRNQQHGTFKKVAWNLTGLEMDLDLVCPKNIDTYINNLSSLKIIESQGSIFKTNDEFYEKLLMQYSTTIKKIEDSIAAKDKTETEVLEIVRGFYEITDLGEAFIRACKK